MPARYASITVPAAAAAAIQHCRCFMLGPNHNLCTLQRTDRPDIAPQGSQISTELTAPFCVLLTAECAPGYAAKGNNGICKACPSSTVAAGGSTLTSACLRCPEGTKPSSDKTECTCGAGHYRASANAGEGFAPVACKPCTARTAYITGSEHTSSSCSTCARGQVANKEHTWCGEFTVCITSWRGYARPTAQQ